MTDHELRNAERAACSGDPDALIQWAVSAWRTGERKSATLALADSLQTGVERAGSQLCGLLGQLAPLERRSYVKELTLLVSECIAGALDLLEGCLPSFRRIRGSDSGLEELRKLICRSALSKDPVRLASNSNVDQALVAACLHDLRGGVGLLGRQNNVAPTLEVQTVEHWLQQCSWATVFVYDLIESHFSRLEDRMNALCAHESAKLVYGIRLDAWDAEEFGPFSGLELKIPALDSSLEEPADQVYSQPVGENQREVPELSADVRNRIRQRESNFEDLFRIAGFTVISHRGRNMEWQEAVESSLEWLGL